MFNGIIIDDCCFGRREKENWKKQKDNQDVLVKYDIRFNKFLVGVLILKNLSFALFHLMFLTLNLTQQRSNARRELCDFWFLIGSVFHKCNCILAAKKLYSFSFLQYRSRAFGWSALEVHLRRGVNESSCCLSFKNISNCLDYGS